MPYIRNMSSGSVAEMKHGNKYYLQLSRKIFTEEYSHLSNNAKWLFVVLNELEQEFCGDKTEDYFYRSNEELAKDCNFGLSTLKKAKSELLKTDLVQSWQGHFVDDCGKKSEKHFTYYRIKS